MNSKIIAFLMGLVILVFCSTGILGIADIIGEKTVACVFVGLLGFVGIIMTWDLVWNRDKG